MKNKMTRREYLSLTAAAAAVATIGNTFGCGSVHNVEALYKKNSPIPKRVLGRTGVEVPIIGFGTGSLFQRAFNNRDDEAIQLLHRAVDLGITWFDTAHIYGNNGWSETMVGNVLKTRRKDVFVTTKIRGNKYDLSINRYKEAVHEEATFAPPREILGRMKALEAEIQSDIAALEGMLQ